MTPQELKNSILQQAIQGKLVEQRPEEGTAEELYQQIQAEKQQLIKEKKIKKDKPLPEITDDEKPFDIPDSWKWVRLPEIATSSLGKTLDKSKNTGSLHPYLCSINVYWSGINLVKVKEAKFEDEELPKYRLQKGDLLICEGGEIGRSCVWNFDDEMYYQNALHRVRFRGNINPYYFKYLLEYYKYIGILNQYSKGMTIKHLVQTSLYAICFPLPPLDEQKRIVAKIEELLPLIDRYEVAWSRLEAFNKRFPEDMHKSILQQAIQGKLVEQRPEEGTGEELYQQIQAEKQKLIKEKKIKKDNPLPDISEDEQIFDIPDTWCWVRLQDICSLIADIDHKMPKSVDSSSGYLFLSAKDLLDDGTINYTNDVKYISKEDFDRLSQKALPQNGDIIYSRIGARLGKARVVKSNLKFLVSYSCCLIRPIAIDVLYLRYYLESPIILNHAIKARQSIGVPDLGMGEIKKYPIALPPLSEQERIVAKIEQLLPLCERLK